MLLAVSAWLKWHFYIPPREVYEVGDRVKVVAKHLTFTGRTGTVVKSCRTDRDLVFVRFVYDDIGVPYYPNDLVKISTAIIYE